jgi:hypothetical protein
LAGDHFIITSIGETGYSRLMAELWDLHRKRLPLTLGTLLFIAGIGLWINAWLVVYDASLLTGPVVGDWTGLFWRIFLSGIFLIAGTYLVTKHRNRLKSDLENDPLLRMMKK